MHELVKTWLKELYRNEIEEVKCAISNEEIWELGYDGEGSNLHTENLKILREYLNVLTEKLNNI